MPLFLRFLVVACFVFGSGCFGYTLHTGARGDGVAHVGRGSVYAWGLVGKQLDSQCPAGLAYVRTYQPWWSGIVALLTIGIVTPWRATYECAAPDGQVVVVPATAPPPPAPATSGPPPNPIGAPAP